MRSIRFVCFQLLAILLTISGERLLSQTTGPIQGPIPAPLFKAKTAFISNGGADSGLFPHPFSGDPDRAYALFFTDMRHHSRLALVEAPASADLVLELRLTAPPGPRDGDKVKGTSDPLPMLRLVVWDRATHFVLWTLTESIDPAALQKTHDRNFDEAMDRLVGRLEDVLSPPQRPQPAVR
jgi:hypothetical protein